VRRAHLLEGRIVRVDELPDRLWKITYDQDGDGVNEFEQILDGDSSRVYWDYLDGAYDLTVSGGGPR
jgi:hypothetical protein